MAGPLPSRAIEILVADVPAEELPTAAHPSHNVAHYKDAPDGIVTRDRGPQAVHVLRVGTRLGVVQRTLLPFRGPSKACEITALFPRPSQVFDIGEHEGERYLTMELVSGRSLSRRLSDAAASAGRGLPLSEIVELMSQICAGLQAAHESGVVHCAPKIQ